jgi:LmbE family N-acetylglucosaminyl deacetylase
MGAHKIMKTILVVAAHPDDEVLGCGGTIAKHVKDGDDVSLIIMADGVSSRDESNASKAIRKERENMANESGKLLGLRGISFLGFPDNLMDSLSLLEIIKPLELLISKIKPDVIYTHHGGDLNIDHQITHRAVMTACRPQPSCSVKEVYSFEVNSSTDWSSRSIGTPFVPQKFVDISNEQETKMAALNVYHSEMRPYPHSRSFEAVIALDKYRGASIGCEYAEAYVVERLIS